MIMKTTMMIFDFFWSLNSEDETRQQQISGKQPKIRHRISFNRWGVTDDLSGRLSSDDQPPLFSPLVPPPPSSSSLFFFFSRSSLFLPPSDLQTLP